MLVRQVRAVEAEVQEGMLSNGPRLGRSIFLHVLWRTRRATALPRLVRGGLRRVMGNSSRLMGPRGRRRGSRCPKDCRVVPRRLSQSGCREGKVKKTLEDAYLVLKLYSSACSLQVYIILRLMLYR